jgi:Na+-transporting NADH:ubiquinone oxidoreductase subunit NqrD
VEALLVLITVLVPIIMGVDEILKSYIPEKFHKLIPIIVGLVLGLCGSVFAPGLTIAQMLWAGFLSGMAAGGSYKPTLMKKG